MCVTRFVFVASFAIICRPGEREPSQKRVGYFPACSSSGQGLWIINTANYKPDDYPSSDVYGNDLAGLNNDLTCPLYAYSVGKNKQSGYAWSDNYTSYK